jgi:hypothetical protein
MRVPAGAERKGWYQQCRDLSVSAEILKSGQIGSGIGDLGDDRRVL